MKDSALRLQDKTILLAGPFNGITQALLRTMTEFGSDVALVSDQTPNASRFVDGLNEAREARPDYGRAAYFHQSLKGEGDIREALGRMAEGFGRTDVLIDATPLSWDATTERSAAVATSKHLAEQVIPFFAAKQRGRVLYVFEDESLAALGKPMIAADARRELVAHIEALAKVQRGKNITVNGLALGVTEDYILRHFAKSGSIRKSLEELQRDHAALKLVEANDVGLSAGYLASALSGSLTGTVLRLTHGFHLA